MKNIWEIHRIADRKGKLSYQIFEIYDLEVSKSFFNKIKNHPNIYVVTTIPKSIENYSMANTCQYLESPLVKPIELDKSLSRLRFSMSALIRVRYEDNICLLIEKSQIKPIGGSFHYKKKPSFKDITFDKEHSKDLRFTVNISEVENVLSWWENCTDERETSPLRELKEELILENDIVTLEEFNKEFKDLL